VIGHCQDKKAGLNTQKVNNGRLLLLAIFTMEGEGK
jgi:hypothetical protein